LVVIGRALSPLQTARLRAAIAALPEPRRSVYLLCARDQLAYVEIAGRLALTVPEVRRQLSEALADLLAAIEDDCPSLQ
jgi:DNA-directed RNA polymerase specialized sigma24 family protein